MLIPSKSFLFLGLFFLLLYFYTYVYIKPNELAKLFVFLQPEAISTFTSDPALISFAEFFCKPSEGMKHVSFLSRDECGCSINFFSIVAFLWNRGRAADGHKLDITKCTCGQCPPPRFLRELF